MNSTLMSNFNDVAHSTLASNRLPELSKTNLNMMDDHQTTYL